jgi:hypothetical protein
MSYAQGGLIEASDYNNFLNGSNQINTIWATGTGNAGYGQTALSTVSQSALITAPQWATLINTLNSIRIHQSGSGSGISAVTSGQKIDHISTLATQINTGYTNRLSFASNSAVTGSVGGSLSTAWTNATTSSTLTRAFGVRCAFSNGDQARYFFNAGGRIKLNLSGSQNSSTTDRTNAIINLLTYLGGVGVFGATTNGGRTGSGGTLGTNDTTKGYWNSTYNSNVTLVSVTSVTSAYTSDTASIVVNCNGTQSNGGNGLNVDFWINLSSLSGTNGPGGTYSFNDSIGVNVIRTIDVSYPETTNISNSWGTVSVSSL